MPSSLMKHGNASSGDPIAGGVTGMPRAHGARVGKTLLVLVPAALVIPLHAAADSGTWAAAPSPNAIFQFQKDNRPHPWLHITTDSGLVERRVRHLDLLGLHDLSGPRGVRLTGSMPWSRISRVDEVVTGAGPWSKVGAVSVGVLGAGLGNALGAPNNLGGRFALAGLAVFGGVGGYLGGRYGSRFRFERNWYVADTTRHVETVAQIESSAPASATSADRAVLDACNRIGRNELFRAYGSFGSFRGYAGIAGPEGLESLRADRHERRRGVGATPPQRISWEQIDRVEMRGGSAINGAMIGGATFGVFGARLGMAAIALSDSAGVSVAEGALVGALYVAPVGIALGGLSGMAVRRWVSVYQRH